jgi:putative ABC transport system permease protein
MPLGAEALSPAVDIVGMPVVIASLTLVLLAIVLSRSLGLRVEASVAWASIRAATQLVAVGFLLGWIFRSAVPGIWAWLWIAVMAAITSLVLTRRIPEGPRVALPAITAICGATAVSLGVVFGFGVFEAEPVTLVVVAGITFGNVLPTAVLAAAQGRSVIRDRPQAVEALLALGFDRRAVIRELAPRAARLALIPQLERTKVVGLIALPGALTGLLLAGVDPVDAVIVQLLVMYLVLGSAAVAAVVMVYSVVRAGVSADLRLAGWVMNDPVSAGGPRRRS